MKLKAGFWKKLNKIDNTLARLIKKKKDSNTWNRSYYKKYHTNKSVVREYYVKLYVNKLKNLEEMDKFLETYNLPRLKKKIQKI